VIIMKRTTFNPAGQARTVQFTNTEAAVSTDADGVEVEDMLRNANLG